MKVKIVALSVIVFMNISFTIKGVCENKIKDTCPEVLVVSNFNISRFKNYLESNKKLDIEHKISCLDTINFEHKKQYFFRERAPFAQLKNNNYVIVNIKSDACIFIYGPDGNFIKELSRYGEGPGEILPLTCDIDFDDSKFYISEEAQRKIIIFNYNGDFIREIRHSRKYAPADFKISPILKNYFYYHVFPFPNTPLFTKGNLEKGFINEFGEIDEINKVAQHAGDLCPMVFNEKGYLFIIKPEEYGYEIYTEEGRFVKKITRNKPDFFDPVSMEEIKKGDEVYQGMEFPALYLNKTRTEMIYYLGENILMIVYVRWCLPDSKEKITLKNLTKGLDLSKVIYKKNIEFWRADGIYLGTIEIDDHRIIEDARAGYFYFWQLDEELDEYGIYPNPELVKYDLWKDAELRR